MRMKAFGCAAAKTSLLGSAEQVLGSAEQVLGSAEQVNLA